MRVYEVLPVTFLSAYAFQPETWCVVGGVALRYRLYSPNGLDVPTITRVAGGNEQWSTNWLGYILLAAGSVHLGVLSLQPNWELGETGLRLIGIALLAMPSLSCSPVVCPSGRSWPRAEGMKLYYASPFTRSRCCKPRWAAATGR